MAMKNGIMAEVSVLRDLVYSVVDGEELLLDLYLPSIPSETNSVVVYVHGGGWAVGDKAEFSETRLQPVAYHGIAVASINYRLAPGARFPAPIQDVEAAIRWLRDRSASHGLQIDSIGLWGASAGAYLASMAALRGLEKVDAVVSWFGPTDLFRSSRRSSLENAILSPPVEVELLGQDNLNRKAISSLAASPIDNVTPNSPPFLIVHGALDRIVSESEGRHLFNALEHYGCETTFVVLGGAGHEDSAFDSAVNLAWTASWLRSHLDVPTTK